MSKIEDKKEINPNIHHNTVGEGDKTNSSFRIIAVVLSVYAFLLTGLVGYYLVVNRISVPSKLPLVEESVQKDIDTVSDIDAGMYTASGSADYAKTQYLALTKFRLDMQKVFNGQVEHSSDPNKYYKEDVFQSEIGIPYQTYEERFGKRHTYQGNRKIVIIARKYTPGFVAEMGYEGSKWEVNFDEWVDYLKKLTPQTKSVVRVNSWGKSDKPMPAMVKKWGEYTFDIYDYHFKPAGNYDRNFVTYDEKNQQIIEVIAQDYLVDIEWLQDSATHKYGDVTEEHFSSVEDALANITSQQ